MLFSLQKMWQWPHWIIHCHICHILCHKLIMPTTLTKIPIAFQKQLPKLYYLTNTHNFLFTQWGRNWKNSVHLNKMKIIGCVALLWHFQSVKIENVKIKSVEIRPPSRMAVSWSYPRHLVQFRESHFTSFFSFGSFSFHLLCCISSNVSRVPKGSQGLLRVTKGYQLLP